MNRCANDSKQGVMVNFRDPNLVLIKNFRGNKKSYFQVSSLNQTEVSLRDIEQGGNFTFSRKQIESHITNGLLVVSSRSEIPESLFVNPVRKKSKPKSSPRQAENELEMERRYRYVKAVLDSQVPRYTAKWLGPWLKEKCVEFKDDNPPHWRTFARWIQLYVESGWKKNSLMPEHSKKGNRTIKRDKEIVGLLDQVVRDHCKTYLTINYTKAHKDFLERVEKLNQKRANEGLALLSPSSYRTTVNRFQNVD